MLHLQKQIMLKEWERRKRNLKSFKCGQNVLMYVYFQLRRARLKNWRSPSSGITRFTSLNTSADRNGHKRAERLWTLHAPCWSDAYTSQHCKHLPIVQGLNLEMETLQGAHKHRAGGDNSGRRSNKTYVNLHGGNLHMKDFLSDLLFQTSSFKSTKPLGICELVHFMHLRDALGGRKNT